MPGIVLDQLLSPISEAAPSGDNLEYDPSFSELERAAAGTEERQSGNEVIPAKEPEWKEMRRLAVELLGRTKDLRVAVQLARAETALEGVDGLAPGIALVRGLLERYWDDIYPRLEAEDDYDPAVRTNALVALSDAGGLLGIVRKTYLVEAKSVGRFSFRDLDIAEQRSTAPQGEASPTMDLLMSALREVGADYVQAKLARLKAVQLDLRAIDAIFVEKAKGGGPNFEALEKTLFYGSAFLEKGLPIPEDAVMAEGEGGELSAGQGTGGSSSGALRSRDDVKRILEQVCLFIERTEPSNPAPILIRRAGRLLDKNFLDIIQDLAPDAIAQVEKLAGSPPAA